MWERRTGTQAEEEIEAEEEKRESEGKCSRRNLF
jgi:hypothetical protein